MPGIRAAGAQRLPVFRGLIELLWRYGVSIAGVALVTWLISLVLPHYHVANISMVYLLLVLALSVYTGSGPAILASVLAFLAFDWFFVPPVGRFTVTDPNEWLALSLFLAVAIITGQLAAALHRRAEEARRRARETQMLYELGMAILGGASLQQVLQVIAERLVLTLRVRSASIWMAGEGGVLRCAVEAGELLGEEGRARAESGVRWAVESAHSTEQYGQPGAVRVVRPLEQGPRRGRSTTATDAYVPILLDSERPGVVAISTDQERDLPGEERARLLEAFAAQTALAISRARLVEEEERARTAAESDRLKSTFLASVSHDLRTPLTAIKAAAAGLRAEAFAADNAQGQELAGSIEREADRLNRLVGNLLEMSRIEAGGLPPHVSPEDFAELLGTAVGRLQGPLESHSFTAVIPSDLPLVSCDASQIDRLLTNLLDNAAKHSPLEGRIVLEAFAENGMLRVSIYNDAAQLSDQDRARIFEKFYRLAASREGARGTGLGLAICKGIVEAHGGRIQAENATGGVRFVFTLPLAVVRQPALQTARERA